MDSENSARAAAAAAPALPATFVRNLRGQQNSDAGVFCTSCRKREARQLQQVKRHGAITQDKHVVGTERATDPRYGGRRGGRAAKCPRATSLILLRPGTLLLLASPWQQKF